ncbi:hypothetical protein NQ318_012859 [Aromia moschata]|uniref:Uncharacterized protein n=1 Tax=Aromia moschata TaxID=1265417 RepID=A0AAV8YCB8_9CUCU|nr:hypothetical protein NQ318_012859 [Aromia moschata]
MEKKKIDPGWNDPPMLNYNASNPPPKSRITNKRVAFPLSGNATQTFGASNAPNVFRFTPRLADIPVAQKSDLLQEEILEKVKVNFNKLLENKDPRNDIYLFSNYLVQNNNDSAHMLKEKLLGEFKDTCNEWLSGIKI